MSVAVFETKHTNRETSEAARVVTPSVASKESNTVLRPLDRRLSSWSQANPVASALLQGSVLVFLVAFAEFSLGLPSAIRALYVLGIWRAVQIEGRPSGLAVVSLITFLVGYVARRQGMAFEDLLPESLMRFACFGAIMLTLARFDENFRSLRQLSMRDPLTGLLNRRALVELAAELTVPSGDHGLTVALIDCDEFKGLNDAFGHHAGDQVLQILARILESETRRSDLVVRLGGDEFVLVLTDLEPREAKHVLARIEHSFRQSAYDAGYPCTISLGVAETSNEVMDLDELLKEADRAMYQRKNRKRAEAYLN